MVSPIPNRQGGLIWIGSTHFSRVTETEFSSPDSRDADASGKKLGFSSRFALSFYMSLNF